MISARSFRRTSKAVDPRAAGSSTSRLQQPTGGNNLSARMSGDSAARLVRNGFLALLATIIGVAIVLTLAPRTWFSAEARAASRWAEVVRPAVLQQGRCVDREQFSALTGGAVEACPREEACLYFEPERCSVGYPSGFDDYFEVSIRTGRWRSSDQIRGCAPRGDCDW